MRTLARRADDAVARRDWQAAAAAYALILDRQPHRADLRIQFAHCLKEAGEADCAAEAYARAAKDAPTNSADAIDAAFHLGLLWLEQKQPDAAVEALNTVLRSQPRHAAALDTLWHSRLLLRLPAQTRAQVREAIGQEIVEREHALAQAKARLGAAERHPACDYASFRPRMTFAPPWGSPHGRIDVIVDARGSAPAFIRATVESLVAQSFAAWRARIYVDAEEALHPVASLAALESRLCFVSAHDIRSSSDDADATVFLSAGSHLDPHALAWVSYGLGLPDVDALSCDWDWCRHSWDGPLVHSDPELYGLFDLDRLLAMDMPPPLVAFARNAPASCLNGEGRRRALADIAGNMAVGHVPLPLVAIGGIAERARIAPENGEPMPLWSQARDAGRDFAGLPLDMTARDERPPLTCGRVHEADEKIRIIIPTRDCVADLAIAVDSLLGTACRPELLTFCLIDNRSVEGDTADYLRAAAARPGFTVLAHDEAFNWSAINNRGAQEGDEPILVLANNDIRMLSPGWDNRLRGQLQRADVGAVGARLLYPDGGIQHAGIVFGIHEDAPQHEGVDVELPDPAHDPRFDRVQACSAVTGAFLALRRDTFRAAGGLDADRFIIAYNDIDLCLSLRKLGLTVLYDPGIEAIHYESRTRGLNDSRRRVAWDQEELRSLHGKWGDAMRRELGLSPWWARDARYAALRQLSPDDVARHMRDGLVHRWRPQFD
ncbi:glycosyltransferase [Novosphingobium gossypii]|uniref:glycosyltransferase n=1 Tax=Novosphingobium gossypii TaxID=1604774 RepID=UPI003D263CA5